MTFFERDIVAVLKDVEEHFVWKVGESDCTRCLLSRVRSKRPRSHSCERSDSAQEGFAASQFLNAMNAEILMMILAIGRIKEVNEKKVRGAENRAKNISRN